MGFDKAIESALRNIANFGDTDIFPFPFEKYVFLTLLVIAVLYYKSYMMSLIIS